MSATLANARSGYAPSAAPQAKDCDPQWNGRRVLVLVQHPEIQGPLPKHTPLLLNGLREAGLTVCTEPWGRRRDGEPIRKKLFGRFIDLFRILRRLRRERFDALVVKSAHVWPALIRDVPLTLLARPLVASIVVQFHGGWSDRLVAPGHWFFKLASSLLQRSANGCLLLSFEECAYWKRFRPRGRYRRVSNPFVAKFAPPAFSDAWKAEDGVPTLLFVGRLMHEKGVMDLLEAVGLMKASQPCRLWIVGSGPLHADATRRSSELGLGERVHLRGYLEGEELMNAYRTADLFVLPTYWAEGFPTVITEAMSMGLPIITTRLRGTADHLRAGDNVLFVPPRNPEKLAGAISSVLGDVELRSRMYSENLKKVAEFDPHQVARAYLDALAEVSDWTRAPVMNGANGER